MAEYRCAMTVKAFVRYCYERFKRETEEKSYRIYVTDALRGLCGGEKVQRWIDIITPQKVDTRSQDEIINDIITGAGITIIS